MNIQQFGALFKAFKIYPLNIVEQFLKSYRVQPDIRINDPTWNSFISEVVLRFGGARNHIFLLSFLKSVSHAYTADERHNDFILDLLQLKVPELFAVEEETDESAGQVDMEVAKNFSEFLNCYVQRHVQKHIILSHTAAIMVSIHVY